MRADVTRLRVTVETVTAAEQGARAQLDVDLKTEVRAFHEHLRIMEQKFEEEQGALLFEVAQLKEAAREAATAAAASGSPPQAFVASASATKLHLTQRKGVRGNPHLWRWCPVGRVAVHHRGLAEAGERGLREPSHED